LKREVKKVVETLKGDSSLLESSCHAVGIDYTGQKNMPLIGGLYHAVGLYQMWSKNMPVIRGLCHTADFDQLWSKKINICPSSEDFVTSRT
jgi:hypothetical protein